MRVGKRGKQRTNIRTLIRRAVRQDPGLLSEGAAEVCRVIGLDPAVHRGNVHRHLERLRQMEDETAARAADRETVPSTPSTPSEPEPEAPTVSAFDLGLETNGLITADEVLALTRAVFGELAGLTRLRKTSTRDLMNLVELLTSLVPVIDKGQARRVGAVLPLNPLQAIFDERRRAALQ